MGRVLGGGWYAQNLLMEILTKQHKMLLKQVMKKEEGSGNGKPIETGGYFKNAWVAGPAPIRRQKMGPEDDPETYLPTFERVATVAG